MSIDDFFEPPAEETEDDIIFSIFYRATLNDRIARDAVANLVLNYSSEEQNAIVGMLLIEISDLQKDERRVEKIIKFMEHGLDLNKWDFDKYEGPQASPICWFCGGDGKDPHYPLNTCFECRGCGRSSLY